jgi:hypothetical protein
MIYEEPGETPGTKRTITEGGLPALVGSDLELAREIRARILIEADDVLTRLRSDEIITAAQVDTDITSPRQVTGNQVHSAEIALNRLRNEMQSAWWIAQSDRSAGDILAESMKAATGHP